MSGTRVEPLSSLLFRRLARRALFAFTLTFTLTRILVFLIMTRRLPDFYLHLGGTHVHHLNYGIFLLAGVGAHLLFAPGRRPGLNVTATLYGVGLALTFDEFGMWLHLGGAYWQRASFDAVIVLGALLALAAFAPPPSVWRASHARAALAIALSTILFYGLLVASTYMAADLEPLERLGPP
ncbi:MAG: hypothetical protein ABI672_16965 [Vicinamibacteria bacterium]